MTKPAKTSIGFACKHAFLSPNQKDPTSDLLVAKLTEYFSDGSEKNLFVRRHNYKRPFYIVKKEYRKFKQKKSYIAANKLTKYTTNQSMLAREISKKLFGRDDKDAKLPAMLASPYVFGCHESATVVFKQSFFDKFGDIQEQAKYTVAAFDIETAVVDSEDGIAEINMASVTFGDKIFWCGVKSFFKEDDTEVIYQKLKAAEEKYLDKAYKEEYNVNVQYLIVDRPEQVVVECVRRFHAWQPDYIVSWNANFDMENCIAALKKANIDPAFVFSDPAVPDEFKMYNYYAGREAKKTTSGKRSALEDQEKFPVLTAPARWQWFDGMSFTAISRVQAGKMEGHSLQHAAKTFKVPGKLYTEEGSHILEGSTDWHIHMQKYHPYIYAIYNIQDNIVIENINRKTQDYSLALPALLASSDLQSYESMPQLNSDRFAAIALENGQVWGTRSTWVEKPAHLKILPDKRQWIGMLHAELVHWIHTYTVYPENEEEDDNVVETRGDAPNEFSQGMLDIFSGDDITYWDVFRKIVETTPFLSHTFVGFLNSQCPHCGHSPDNLPDSDTPEDEKPYINPLAAKTGFTPIDPVMNFFDHTRMLINQLGEMQIAQEVITS